MASISMGTWTGIYDWSLIHERAVRQMIRFECLAASLQSKINCNMLQEWLLARKRAWDRGRGGKGGRLSDSLINKLITQQEIRPHCGHAHPPPAVRKDNQLERKRERERQRMKLFGAELTGKPHESVFGQPTKPKRSEAKRSEAHLSNLYGNVSIINGVDCFAANVWRIGIETRDIWRIYIHIHRVPSILCVTEGHTVRLKLRVQISFSRNSTMGK